MSEYPGKEIVTLFDGQLHQSTIKLVVLGGTDALALLASGVSVKLISCMVLQ